MVRSEGPNKSDFRKSSPHPRTNLIDRYEFYANKMVLARSILSDIEEVQMKRLVEKVNVHGWTKLFSNEKRRKHMNIVREFFISSKVVKMRVSSSVLAVDFELGREDLVI